MRIKYLLFMGIVGLMACKQSSPLGDDPLNYGQEGTPKTVISENVLLKCPSDKHIMIDALSLKQVDDFIWPSQSNFNFQKHTGGRIRAVASVDGNIFWSRGSTLYANSDDINIELAGSINDIIATKGDGRVLLTLATKKGLETLVFDGKTFSTQQSFNKLGEVISLSLTKSSDFTRKVEIPIDISLNVPPDGKPFSKNDFTKTVYPDSEYLYMSTDSGAFRMKPSMLSSGCIERIWAPPDPNIKTRLIKIVANNNYIGILTEEINADFINSMNEKSKIGFYSKLNFGKKFIYDEDTMFLFKYSTATDKVKRKVRALDLASNYRVEEEGIFSDIAIHGDELLAALYNVKPATVFDKIFKKILGNTAIEDTASLVKFDLKTNSKSVVELPLDKNNGDYRSIWNKLLVEGDNVFLWGTNGYVLDILKMEFLSPPNDLKLRLSPYKYTFDTTNNQLIGIFPSLSDGLLSFTGNWAKNSGSVPIQLSGDGKLVATLKVDHPILEGEIIEFNYLKGNELEKISNQQAYIADPFFMADSSTLNMIAYKDKKTEDSKLIFLTSTDTFEKTLESNFGKLQDVIIADQSVHVLSRGEKDISMIIYGYSLQKECVSELKIFKTGFFAGVLEISGQKDVISIFGDKIGVSSTKFGSLNNCQVSFLDANNVFVDAKQIDKSSILAFTDLGELKLINLADGKVKEIAKYQTKFANAIFAKLAANTTSKIAYLLVSDQDFNTFLLKFNFSDLSQLSAEIFEGYFYDIAISEKGGLIGASIDNGLEFYQ